MSNGNQDGYGNLPPMGQSKKPAGCNPIFFVVIAIGIFFLLNGGVGNRPANVEPNEDQWEEPAGSSDWEMQELEATPSNNPPSDTTKPRANKTSDGDWSIEEVETNSDRGVELKAKDAPKPKSKKTSKKTSKGDWEFEEVGGG